GPRRLSHANEDRCRGEPVQTQMLVSPPDDRTALLQAPNRFLSTPCELQRAHREARVLGPKGVIQPTDAEGRLRVLERSLQFMDAISSHLLDELMSWPRHR